jgi:hypothetical protein
MRNNSVTTVTNKNMRRTTTIKIALTILFIASAGISTSAFQSNTEITKNKAIKLAEQFIIDNGYTNLPADKSKISYELLDRYDHNLDSIVKHRHNTLQRKAFCIVEDKDGWNVGFLSNVIDLSKLNSAQRKTNLPGRAVIILKN